MSLPYQTTTVSERTSMTNIQVMLENTGFEQTAVITDHGVHKIIAVYKRQSFEFDIDTESIVTAMINDLGHRSISNIRNKTEWGEKKLRDIQLQAVKVGWRLMYIHIKAVCDSIKLGVISPSQAFAGHALIGVKGGQPVTLAQILTQKIENNEILSDNNVFLIEAKK